MELSLKTEFLAPPEALDIAKTLDCGQCFRFNELPNGSWYGVAGRHDGLFETRQDGIFVTSSAPEGFWSNYFDMSLDYSALSADADLPDYLKICAEYGAGIRILNQDPWEAICSFIISQCNNIKRIKGIVERLCSLCGEELPGIMGNFHAFPTAETVAALEPSDLEPLRSGYRAPYIIAAARAVSSGELVPEELYELDFEEAKKRLMALPGIGPKVADCAVLFGLHKLEAFPKDVWIKRALKEHFPPDFDPASLGPCAGVFQQYIFHYIRNNAFS